eukprot:TRINITY_DN26479_c0_g1_i1.p1 TRINITY_DN26479_c0_g1~~TRINITY_DN26479_c0_g1_i1.p1  ORF type:complete len:150 (+),score=33.89 TRINITY_DN26479_c0_g1_i1:110-559(+)
MIRRPPRSTQGVSSAASDVYKRQQEMLRVVRRSRKEIMLKLDMTKSVKPGTFIRQLGANRSGAATARVQSSAQYDEPTLKFLEKQSQTNREQLDFFLKEYERHDVNVMKNMGSTVEYLKRREEMDQKREEELLRSLTNREELHLSLIHI